MATILIILERPCITQIYTNGCHSVPFLSLVKMALNAEHPYIFKVQDILSKETELIAVQGGAINHPSSQINEWDRIALGTLPIAMLITGPDGKIIFANPRLAAMFGYSPEELQGQLVEILLPERFRSTHVMYRQQDTENMTGRDMGLRTDLVGRHKNGNEFPIEVGLSYFHQDNKVRIFVSVIDITLYKKQDQLLKQREEYYRRLVERSPLAIFIYQQNHIVYASPACERFFDSTQPASLIGQSPLTLFHPDSHPLIQALITPVTTIPADLPFTDAKIIRRNGNVADVAFAATYFLNENGIAVQFILADISKRKQTEEALQFSEDRFHVLVENIREYAIFMLDPRGHIISWNTGAERIQGYQADEIIGCHVSDLYAPEDRLQGKPDELLRIAESEGSAQEDGIRLRKDGTCFYANVVLTALYDKAGQLRGFTKVVRDITERKLAGELLERRVAERTQELERRRRAAEGLHDVLTMLNSNQPVEEILRYIVKQATQLLNANACAIFHLQAENNQMATQVNWGLPNQTLREAVLPISEENLPGFVALHKSPVVIPDLARISRPDEPMVAASRRRLLENGYRAILAIPLLTKGNVSGNLTLYYQDVHTFTEQEIELAHTFSKQAALALANERLHRQLEENAVLSERNRLARELHDAVTQALFSASLIADVLPKLWQRDEKVGKAQLDELRTLTRGALAEMRILLLELRPTKLRDVELADLLHRLAEASMSRACTFVTVQIEGEVKLPVETKIALYRIAQEAMNNIVKHAQAQHSQISLRGKPESVELLITDDGCGFSAPDTKPHSLGLGMMWERATSIGAELDIQSLPGHGTMVRAYLPTKIYPDS